MRKYKAYYVFLFLCAFLCQSGLAQTPLIDSLQQVLQNSPNDTNRVNILSTLSRKLIQKETEQALTYAREGIKLSKELNFENGRIMCEAQVATIFYFQAKYHQAADYLTRVLSYYRKKGQTKFQIQTSITLGTTYEKLGRFDEALEILQEALQLANDIQYKRALPYCINNIANVYLRKAEYDKAISSYQKAVELYESAQPDQNLANTYRNIGIVYKLKGDYDQALQYFYKALELSERLAKPVYLSEVWNSIGTVFTELNRPDKSKAAFQKALAYLDRETPSKRLYNIYINLGKSHFFSNELDSALYYYHQSLSMSDSLEGFLSKGVLFNNIGNVHLKREAYRTALDYFHRAIEADSLIENEENTGRTLMSMGKSYLLIGDYTQSIKYLSSALEIVEKIGAKQIKSNTLKYLSEAYRKNEDTEKAFDYFQRHVAVKDSLFNKATAAKIDELIFDHETTKKQQKIKLLEQSRTNQKLVQHRLWIILIATGLIGVLIFLYQGQRIRNIKQRETLLDIQKNLLELQMLRNQMKPHFVFNALTSIQNFLLLKDNPKAIHYLSEFAQLMREMLENTDKDFISLEDEINYLNRYLKLEQLRSNNQFSSEISIAENLTPEDIFIPNLLLQPIVENAIWHGVMPLKKEGKISIRLTRENGLLKIAVEDNGVGRKFKKNNLHQSKGLHLLKQRIEMLNKEKDLGIHWFIQDLKDQRGQASGTLVRLTFPL